MRLYSLLVGFLVFIVVVGALALLPDNYQWLLMDDRSQGFISWEFFRRAPWSLPLGYYQNFLYPIGNTVTQGDALGFIALPLKLFSAYLPSPFQYVGLWLLVCFSLQAFYARKIFQQLGLSTLGTALGVFILTLAPPLFYRVFHPSLCAHWIILYWIYQYMVDKNRPNSFYSHILVLIIATGTHPYICAISLALAMPVYFRNKKSFVTKESYLKIGALIALTLLVQYLLGYYKIKSPSDIGFGSCSVDLLAPLNSFGVSPLIPPLRSNWCGYEGISYIGLGGIFLLLAYFIFKKRFSTQHSAWPYGKSIFVVVGLLGIYALASPLRFGGNPIIYLDWIYGLLGPLPHIFRASGRFIWPAYYLFFILLLFVLDKNLGTRHRNILFCVTFLLWGFEFIPHLWAKPISAYQANDTLAQNLKIKLPEGQILHLYPGFYYTKDEECAHKDGFSVAEFYQIAFAATQKSMKITSGMVPRPSTEVLQKCKNEDQGVINASTEDFFLIHPKYWAKFQNISKGKFHCNPVETYQLCTKSIEEVIQ